MNQIYLGSTLINDAFLGDDRMSNVLTNGLIEDTDAQNFFNATGITNTELRRSVINLVLQLKSASLWTDMDLIYPFVGDNTASLSTQLSFNLKNTASFQATLTNGSTDSNFNGYSSSAASTRHIRTGYIPTTQRGQFGDYHLSVYTTTDGNQGDAQDVGAFVVGPGNPPTQQRVSIITAGRSKSGINSTKFMWLGQPNFVELIDSGSVGFFVARYNNSLTPRNRMSRNGTSILTSSFATTGSATVELFVGATNNSSTASAITTKQYQFVSVGAGLTDTKMQDLNTIVQAFQTNVDVAMGTTRSIL